MIGIAASVRSDPADESAIADVELSGRCYGLAWPDIDRVRSCENRHLLGYFCLIFLITDTVVRGDEVQDKLDSE